MSGKLEGGQGKGKTVSPGLGERQALGYEFQIGTRSNIRADASLDINVKGMCCLTRKDKGGTTGITGWTAGHC